MMLSFAPTSFTLASRGDLSAASSTVTTYLSGIIGFLGSSFGSVLGSVFGSVLGSFFVGLLSRSGGVVATGSVFGSFLATTGVSVVAWAVTLGGSGFFAPAGRGFLSPS